MRIYRVRPYALLSVSAVVAASLASTSTATATSPTSRSVTLGEGDVVRLTNGKTVRGPKAEPNASGARSSGAAAPARPPSPEYAPREVIVRFDATATAAERAALRSSVGAVSSVKIGPANASTSEKLTLPAGASTTAAVAKLEASGDVDSAQRNAISHLAAAPNDEYFADQWPLHNVGGGSWNGVLDADIDAPEGWNTNIGSSSVTIAVIDTGVDYTHPDLSPNMWTNAGEWGPAPGGGLKQTNGIDDDGNGYVDDFRGVDTSVAVKTSPAAADPKPLAWHGTHVASLAAARGNNSIYISGVAQQAKILPVQAFHVDGDDVVATDEDILEGVQYAIAKGAQVINGSFGGSVENPALTALIAANPNVTFVFAAGNEGVDVDATPTFPCATPGTNVICVGATNGGDVRTTFSNYGSTAVDLSAAGEMIPGLVPMNFTFGGQSIGWWGASGTSMATPIVAGSAAVLKSASPSLTGTQVRQRLVSTADPVVPNLRTSVGNGRVNLANALANTVPSAGAPSTVSVAAGKLTYTAASGASNLVEVTASGSAILVGDARVNVTPGAGCTAVTAKQVSCSAAGVTAAEFNLGDGNDGLDAGALTVPATVNAGDGRDQILTGSGADTVNAGSGNDWVDSGTGNDTINGGDGHDQLNSRAGSDVINGGDGNDVLNGSGNNDVLRGDGGDDELSGAGGNDQLYGGDGNDFLHTGEGTGLEIADGGAGNDELVNTVSANQRFIGGSGTDRVDYRFPAYPENEATPRTVTIGTSSGNGLPGENDDVGADIEVINGGLGDDILTGGPNPSTLFGNDGNDTLTAGAAATVLDGDGGFYTTESGAGNDVFEDGPGNDTIIGGPGDDQFHSAPAHGNDTAHMGAGNDSVIDSYGNDTYDLGDGDDNIRFLYNTGSDDVTGGAGHDTVDFGLGGGNVNLSLDDVANDGVLALPAALKNVRSDFEVLKTGSGNDTLTGTNSSITYLPGGGKDIVNAGSSADTIVANDGAVDRINAGGGTDSVTADQIDLVQQGELPTLEVNSGVASASAVNLTTDPILGASTDWIHWGGTTGSSNRRKSGTAVIAGWTKNGSASVTLPSGSSTFSWTNAAVAPTSASSTVGSATGSAVGHGFRHTVPVTANQPVTIRAFTGLINGGSGQLRVWYSSNPSAVTSSAVFTNTGTQADRTFTISGRPAANDTINVEWALTASNGSTTRSILYASALYR